MLKVAYIMKQLLSMISLKQQFSAFAEDGVLAENESGESPDLKVEKTQQHRHE
jgi:hypothetical protein